MADDGLAATGLLFEGAAASQPLPDSLPAAALERIATGPIRQFAAAHGLARLVLVAPRLAVRRSPLLAAVRRAGFGPGDVELVAAEDVVAHGALLALAVARLVERRATVPPEALRLSLPSLAQPLNRRALLSGFRLQQTVVPFVTTERCLAWNGCDLCQVVCRWQAIRRQGSAVAVDSGDCTNCGLCVAACPPAAIEHPLFPAAGLDAALRTLFSSPRPTTVVFPCPDLAAAAGDATRTSRNIVPFLGIPPALLGWLWPLRALDLGATAVLVAACPRCLQTATPTLRGAQPLLAHWGAPSRLQVHEGMPDRRALDVLEDGSGLAPGPPASRADLADVILSLWSKLGRPATDPSLLPFRGLSLNTNACSLCGLCAGRCPSGALQFEQDQQATLLSFSAAGCSGCGLCLRACPEKALTLAAAGPLPELAGRAVLARSQTTACPRCGKAGEAQVLMERVLARIPSPEAASHARLCPDCREAALLATPWQQPTRPPAGV